MKPFEFEGQLHAISAPDQVSEKLLIQEVVCKEADGIRDNFVKFQIANDRLRLMSKLSVGQRVNVTFVINGNEAKGKFFNNLNIVDIQRI